MAETPAIWRARQKRANAFTDRFLKGVGPILVDGKPGPATSKRFRECQWWLGWKVRDGEWSVKLDHALRHPNKPHWNVNADHVREGKKRRHLHNLGWIKSHFKTGVTTYDGVRVCRCAVPILDWCRANGWHGRLVSGYRDPWYSQQLCYHMCGHPSCPGLCAGLSSNHVGNTCARFAVDVSDYMTFRSVVARCPVSPHIFNALPHDLVHFSPSGR